MASWSVSQRMLSSGPDADESRRAQESGDRGGAAAENRAEEKMTDEQTCVVTYE